MPNAGQLLGDEGRALLFDVMALMMIADGEIREREVERVGAVVAERPEFRGLDLGEVLAGVRQALGRVHQDVRRDQLEPRVAEIASHLDNRAARLLVYGVAAAIALSDEELHTNELALLALLARAFDLTPVQTEGALRCVRAGLPLDALSPSAAEEEQAAYVEAITLALASDGRVNRAEVRALTEIVTESPALASLSAVRAEGYVRRALEALEAEGLEARLSALGRALSHPEMRVRAYGLVLRVVRADGETTEEERSLLARLRALLLLTRDELEEAEREAGA